MPIVETPRFVQVLVRGGGIPKRGICTKAKSRRVAEGVGCRGVIHREVSYANNGRVCVCDESVESRVLVDFVQEKMLIVLAGGRSRVVLVALFWRRLLGYNVLAAGGTFGGRVTARNHCSSLGYMLAFMIGLSGLITSMYKPGWWGFQISLQY